MNEWGPGLATILGIVEGLTEFLPVSSTGHLILVGHALGFDGELAASAEISIQLGAILAVIAYERHKLVSMIGQAGREQQGVFAVPTFVVDGELFWGQDRIDFVRAKLAA